MKKVNILLTVLILAGLSSCKDFLDVKPTNSGDSKTSIQTPADAQVMINGLMRSMTSSDYYGRNLFLYGDAKGGDMTIASRGRGNDGLYVFDHQASSGSFSGFWSQIYYCILLSNNLLESIEKIVVTNPSTDFNTYKGQALTARALMYFDLVRLYGKSYDDDKSSYGVPNITTPIDASAQPLRASVEQNYIQILADLKAAATLLSKTKAPGYINYYANQAIQARVYLYMKDYPNALKAAEEVMIGYPASALYTNAAWVDSWKTQFGSESVFELGVFPSEGDLTTASLGFYTRRKGHTQSTVLGWFIASDYYLARMNQDPTDVRFGILSFDEISNTRLGALYKYSGSTALAGDGKATATAVNIKVIRLSEIYLIAAEAAFPTDKIKAAGYLQQIRKRSPGLPPATAVNITVDMILDERSKELYGEGHRFFDMIRLNKSITFNDELGNISAPLRTKTIDRTFFRTRLPISQTELNANPGLKAQQNQGY
ncbi:RagB/SusD family nutrient uptake outer membrane protein [Pedobacter heparinus]|uniref:RagB/SusD family nutrient uptake outer membrane protein n=1 Tax=Pedobacter heparinus TaxID=984 RepID=UPI00292D4F19|nr:RagB/SusD family nutrient uptake outer membrane protein [Pedobacter heparinus]